jgi:hypothetical protein
MSAVWSDFPVRVRRREDPLYDLMYRVAKRLRSFSMPCVRPFHSFLYHEWAIRTNVWHSFWCIVYI